MLKPKDAAVHRLAPVDLPALAPFIVTPTGARKFPMPRGHEAPAGVDSFLLDSATARDHACMSEVDDELMQSVLSAVYRCLADDREAWGARHHPQANRFMTALGMARARDAMLSICRDVEADSEFVEFLDSHWLPRFRPLPV